MPPSHVLERSAPGPDLTLRYDAHPDGVIDVFLPAGVLATGTAQQECWPRPLIVVLHGGFWRAEYDRAHLRPLAAALAEAGYVVATPEYRRGTDSWPHMRVDVAKALADVRMLLADAASEVVDAAAPVVLAGHSAGGHLALWGGLRAGADVVRRIVALAPVSDVYYAARTGMGSNAAQDLLGGGPDDVPDTYADADTVRLLPGDVPVVVVQGDEDKQVTMDMNRQLAASMATRAPGAPAFEYVELAGVDHFALIDPESDAWPTVVGALTAST